MNEHSTVALRFLARTACLLGAVACTASQSQSQSGHRSGELVMVGVLPGQTIVHEWTATLRVTDETWCVSEVRIDDELVVSSEEPNCQPRVQRDSTPTSVSLGELAAGRVFAFLAPGRQVIGSDLGSSAGGDASASLGYSQSGDLVIVIVEVSGGANGDQGLILRDDSGNRVTVPLD